MKNRKKKLPTLVDIGGLWFKIKYPIILSAKTRKELGEDTIGYCDWANREIMVVKKWAEKDSMTTIHEIIHAICDSLSPNSKLGREAVVKPLAQMLYGALKSMKLIKN